MKVSHLHSSCQRLTAHVDQGSVKPASGRVEGIGWGLVERDRRIGSVSPDQIDHRLEQLKLLFGLPHTAADNDNLPRSSTQSGADDCLHVVTTVKAEDACLNVDTVLGESRDSHLDRVGYRPGIPRTRHPIRIEPDHEYAVCRGPGVHRPTVPRGDRVLACRCDPPPKFHRRVQ